LSESPGQPQPPVEWFAEGIIDRERKLSGYLLSSTHPDGRNLPIDKPNTRNVEALGDLPWASLHHRGGVKLTHKLLPRNGCRNARETVVL